MQIYIFQKTFSERLDECMSVLSWKDHNIPASQVKPEWSYFLELQIEPSGWQALWKIPRNVCEKLQIGYPTIVFGFVESVSFRDLNAIFDITAVEDESVHLPERHEVALEDLWPTIIQENPELNIQRTADCVDRLRFFYNHIWMPWDNDNDDDFNWVEKHLQSRIRLCFDLRQRNISRRMTHLIRSLINEAKYIQQQREVLERNLSEDSNKCDDKNILEKSQLTQLMRLHLRLTMIRSDVEMLENPDMRHLYEEVKLKCPKPLNYSGIIKNYSIHNNKNNTDPVCYIVSLPYFISNQIELLQAAQNIIPNSCPILFNHSLQDVLSVCKPCDKIYLSAGCHMLNFLEYFFDNGLLFGIESKILPDKSNTGNCVRIYSPDDNSNLLIFDGDFTLENIELDCRNIRTGILVKHGNLTLRNCKLFANGKSSIQQGIIGGGNAVINMEKCVIDNFGTGITLNSNASLNLTDSVILNCSIGLEISEDTRIQCSNSTFNNCKKYGVYHNGLLLKEYDDTFLNVVDITKYKTSGLQWSGDCSFVKCKTNICIHNKINSIIPHKMFDNIDYIL